MVRDEEMVAGATVLLFPCAETPTSYFLFLISLCFSPFDFSLFFCPLLSFFSSIARFFFPPLFCSFLVVFIGARGAGSTLPYLIMAYGERGHPTPPRCRVRWPIKSRL